jgi:hypothetical protein
LIIATGVITPLTITSTWALRTVTSTDHYVETLAPLIEQPAVKEAMTNAVVDGLFHAVNVHEMVASHLPGPSKALAGAITSSIRSEARKVVASVIGSPAFAKLWNGENRLTHHLAVSILSGDSGSTVSALSVSLHTLLLNVIAELDRHGITLFDPLVLTLNHLADHGIVLATAQQLHTVQSVFHLGIALRSTLPFVALGVMVLALIAGRDRRRTGLRLGAAALLGTSALSVVVHLGRTTFVGSVHESSRALADAVWTTVIRGLVSELRLLGVAFTLIILATWIAGTSPLAGRLRQRLGRAITSGETIATEISHSEAVAQARHELRDRRSALAVGVGGVALATVIFSSSSRTAWWALGIGTVAMLWLCVPLFKRTL